MFAMVEAEMSTRLSAPRCSRSGASGALVSENGTDDISHTPHFSRSESAAARNCPARHPIWEEPREMNAGRGSQAAEKRGHAAPTRRSEIGGITRRAPARQ